MQPNKLLKNAHFIRWDNQPLALLTTGCPLAKRYILKELHGYIEQKNMATGLW